MIWNAPSILADAAFQLALSASLLRTTRRIDATGWVGSVWRSTRIPFAIIPVLAATFGFVVSGYCPDSPTPRSVVNECLIRGGRP
jgi:hypothetical protein